MSITKTLYDQRTVSVWAEEGNGQTLDATYQHHHRQTYTNTLTNIESSWTISSSSGKVKTLTWSYSSSAATSSMDHSGAWPFKWAWTIAYRFSLWISSSVKGWRSFQIFSSYAGAGELLLEAGSTEKSSSMSSHMVCVSFDSFTRKSGTTSGHEHQPPKRSFERKDGLDTGVYSELESDSPGLMTFTRLSFSLFNCSSEASSTKHGRHIWGQDVARNPWTIFCGMPGPTSTGQLRLDTCLKADFSEGTQYKSLSEAHFIRCPGENCSGSWLPSGLCALLMRGRCISTPGKQIFEDIVVEQLQAPSQKHTDGALRTDGVPSQDCLSHMWEKHEHDDPERFGEWLRKLCVTGETCGTKESSKFWWFWQNTEAKFRSPNQSFITGTLLCEVVLASCWSLWYGWPWSEYVRFGFFGISVLHFWRYADWELSPCLGSGRCLAAALNDEIFWFLTSVCESKLNCKFGWMPAEELGTVAWYFSWQRSEMVGGWLSLYGHWYCRLASGWWWE